MVKRLLKSGFWSWYQDGEVSGNPKVPINDLLPLHKALISESAFFFFSYAKPFHPAHACPLKVMLEINFSSPKAVFLKFHIEFKFLNDFHIGSLSACLSHFLSFPRDEPLVHFKSKIKRKSKLLFLSVWNDQQTVEVNVTANLQKTCHYGLTPSLSPLHFTLMTAILKSNGKKFQQDFYMSLHTF